MERRESARYAKGYDISSPLSSMLCWPRGIDDEQRGVTVGEREWESTKGPRFYATSWKKVCE